jgi:hypothetical protein
VTVWCHKHIAPLEDFPGTRYHTDPTGTWAAAEISPVPYGWTQVSAEAETQQRPEPMARSRGKLCRFPKGGHDGVP